MTLTSFHLVALFCAALVFIAAAVNDARHFRIPNILCVVLMILFPFFVLTSRRVESTGNTNLMVFGLVLISGFVMFMGNLAGAGDIKLLGQLRDYGKPGFPI